MRHNTDREVRVTERVVKTRVFTAIYRCPMCGVTQKMYRRLDPELIEQDVRFLKSLDKCFSCQESGRY